MIIGFSFFIFILCHVGLLVVNSFFAVGYACSGCVGVALLNQLCEVCFLPLYCLDNGD